MWNMMCDVMPTISEDSISQRSSQFSGEDANFEQLMVSMLDERDKLMDSLRETQERLGETEIKLQETEKERDSLQRQIAANLPQVRIDNCRRRSHVNVPLSSVSLCTDLGALLILSAKLYSPFSRGNSFGFISCVCVRMPTWANRLYEVETLTIAWETPPFGTAKRSRQIE